MQVLVVLGYVAATAWVAVLVHEAGHYLAGRVVGVPARAMRIRLTTAPPHVALRDEERWLAPDQSGYIGAFTRQRNSAAAAWFFIAGGFVVETAAVLAAGFALQDAGTVAPIVLLTSTCILLLYLGADVLGSLRGGQPYGDAGAMWRLHAGGTVLLLAAALAGRAVVLALVW